MSAGRNTARRDKHRTTIKRGEPPCAYEDCLFPGVPIDYQADHLDPLSYTVDHITPLEKGGPDTLDNKQPTHRACNRHKSNKVPYQLTTGVTFVTERCWWAA